MMPVMAYDLLQSVHPLSTVSRVFADRCVRGSRPTSSVPGDFERNLAIVTALAPRIGYDRAGRDLQRGLRHRSHRPRGGAGVAGAARDELERAARLFKMTEAGELGQAGG